MFHLYIPIATSVSPVMLLSNTHVFDVVDRMALIHIPGISKKTFHPLFFFPRPLRDPSITGGGAYAQKKSVETKKNINMFISRPTSKKKSSVLQIQIKKETGCF